jgi:hypothetical protein
VRRRRNRQSRPPPDKRNEIAVILRELGLSERGPYEADASLHNRVLRPPEIIAQLTIGGTAAGWLDCRIRRTLAAAGFCV